MCKDVPSGGARQDRSDALRKLALTRRAAITYATYRAIVDDLYIGQPKPPFREQGGQNFRVL